MEDNMLLITLFCYVSDKFTIDLSDLTRRFSNNHKPVFTDSELVATFLFGVLKKIRDIKDIHGFICTYYGEWFPNIPTYEKYVYRLSRVCSAFPYLCEHIINDFSKRDLVDSIQMIDSMPIIMANQKRSSKAKVASHFANKGCCSSKGIYYYGVKLHVIATKRDATLPLPEYLLLTPASDHDLTVLERIAPNLLGKHLYADKAYLKDSLLTALAENNSNLLTPVKKEKGQEYLDLFQQLFSTSVSKVRQPIESLFNWLDEKTGIQKASKIRSFNGLLIHVYGRLTAALFLMVFN